MTQADRTESKAYRRPDGEPPKPSEKCPKCGAPPNVPHSRRCPWLLWANAEYHDAS